MASRPSSGSRPATKWLRSSFTTWTPCAPDDRGPNHFCDRFEVLTPTARVIGVRRLLHDHTDEQPFSRELHGVHVPEGFPRGVLIRGHHNTLGCKSIPEDYRIEFIDYDWTVNDQRSGRS